MAKFISTRTLAGTPVAVFGLMLLSSAALAQFGTIFGAPPRPPGDVPGRQQQLPPQQQPRAPAPMGLPDQMPPEEMDEETTPPQPPPRQSLPPVATRQQQGLPPGGQPQGIPPPGSIRGQPLAPPPGGTVVPPQQQQGAVPSQNLTPLQNNAPGPQQRRGTPEPLNVAPQPGDEVVTEMPSQKIPNPTAVFAGLDKITGRIITFDVALNETVQFGALQVTPRICYTRPPTESANTDSYVDVDEVTLQGEVKRIFSGWMFAASPGLHAVEHPIYDVWLNDCKGGTTVVADTPPAAGAAATPSAKSQQRPPGQGAVRTGPPGAGAPGAPGAAPNTAVPPGAQVPQRQTLTQPPPVPPPPGTQQAPTFQQQFPPPPPQQQFTPPPRQYPQQPPTFETR